MEFKYQITKQGAKNAATHYTVNLLLIFICLNGFIADSKSLSVFSIGLVSLFFVYLALQKYLSKSQLTINQHGVEINNFLLRKFLDPYKKLKWSDNLVIYKVNQFNKYNANILSSKLSSHDETSLVFVNEQLNHAQLAISNDAWQITDMDELLTFFQTQSYTYKGEKKAEEIAKSYLPEFQSLGKMAGVFVFISVVAAIIGLAFLFLDSFITLDKGYSYSFTAVFGIISFVFCYYCIHSENVYNRVGKLVVPFVAAPLLAFFFYSTFMFTSQYVGSETKMNFAYQGKNEHGRDTWAAEDNPEYLIYCGKTDIQQQLSVKQITVLKTLTMLRVDPDSYCM